MEHEFKISTKQFNFTETGRIIRVTLKSKKKVLGRVTSCKGEFAVVTVNNKSILVKLGVQY